MNHIGLKRAWYNNPTILSYIFPILRINYAKTFQKYLSRKSASRPVLPNSMLSYSRRIPKPFYGWFILLVKVCKLFLLREGVYHLFIMQFILRHCLLLLYLWRLERIISNRGNPYLHVYFFGFKQNNPDIPSSQCIFGKNIWGDEGIGWIPNPFPTLISDRRKYNGSRMWVESMGHFQHINRSTP
jgi:hypothetical protein